MRAKSNSPSTPGSRAVKDIRRATRRQYSAEEKIRIVLDGLRGEDSIAELDTRINPMISPSGRHGLHPDVLNRWFPVPTA